MRAGRLQNAGGLRRPGGSGRILCVAAVGLLACAANALETLLSEDFEKLDLAKLPEGWSLQEPGDISIAGDPMKGQVLRINHKGNGAPTLTVKLDVAKCRGRTVYASVSIKCPGSFTPIPAKTGFPQIMVAALKGGGWNGLVAYIQPNNPGWQSAMVTYRVPADAEGVTVALRVVAVAADAYFDGLVVTAEADQGAAAGNAPPPAQPAAQPRPQADTQPGGQPAAQPGSTPAPTPTGAAATAPKRTLDEDMMAFNPEIAATLQAARKPSASARSFAVVGPGAPVRDIDGKPLDKWTHVAGTKDVQGPAAAPDSLLVALPAFIVANKLEVVILVGEASEGRKLVPLNERFDWEDLARVCRRLGAVPVLAVPPAGANDDLRREMVEAARLAYCPIMDLKTPAMAAKRTRQLFDLLEQHVFERAAPPSATKGETAAPVDE
ncbi:MAG: hypothetical protein NTW87_16280 [Planctomycetota bacterium]|nr:hypothetical protein [Planctomycetota bacterium]